jgi:hypothetical protein
MRAEAPSEAVIEPEPSRSQRPPVRAVTVLMPVWGYRFVSQFLEFCLPTLLAPGNVPAVAKALPCRFVLLSSGADKPLIRSHPSWRQLEQICRAEIHQIDDLITDGNHSATITLAFAQAVRQSGDDMLDTCFIFLVSDYLMADGSLATVVDRIRKGASGVVAGNFQIVAEDAIPLLRRRIDAASTSIVLSPRELVSWSLAHLHPASVANMVNFGLSHNAHTNRLFWRVDENTLIGRFYLMHMIGIRPEVTNFVVGASCDYSFIPEMCPSGNVVALTDSDDYLVVEMQPREHEAKWLLPGPIETHQLADSLSEWTTAQHRGNVANTLVYHAAEIPPNLAEAVAEADAFVDEVRGLLSPEPHPFRHHHYWIGSIAVSRAMTRRPLDREDWTFLLGERIPTGGLTGLLWRLRVKFFGSPPDLTRLHPRWPDYGLPLAALKKLIDASGRTLLVTQRPIAFAQWLTRSAGDNFTLESDRLLELPRDLYLPLVETFDACLMILSEGMLAKADEFIARAGPLLKPGGQIMIMVANERSLEHARGFSREFAHQSARLLDLAAWVTEIHYVPASRLRWAIYRAMARVLQRGDISGWRSPVRLISLAMAALPLSIASYLANLGTRATSTPPPGVWSSVFLVLRPSATGRHLPLPRFKPQREGASWTPNDTRGTRPVRRGTGSTSALSNSLQDQDPVRLAQVLARYHFVASLLSPRHDVAEYGCAESLGTEIVLRAVGRMTVYDPNPMFLGELHRRFPNEWPLEACVHDLLSAPLPKRHDSIYCLDGFQYISRSDEDTYVRHLRDSLSRSHDIVIIGSPSFNETETVSPQHGADAGRAADPERLGNSAAGTAEDALMAENPNAVGAIAPRFLPRTAAELKALLERHFHVVFPFSMTDQVVHAGIHPAADYVLAVCCTRKG